jgi:hypothetical protein
VKTLLSAFLISSLLLAPCCGLFAGDAVAIGYNKDGVWTAVTYYASSTPKGGRDYKTESEACEEALRDVRRRSQFMPKSANILASSDVSGFVSVAGGTVNGKGDITTVRRGKSQAEADQNALAELKKAGAYRNQKIVYRYHSYGS